MPADLRCCCAPPNACVVQAPAAAATGAAKMLLLVAQRKVDSARVMLRRAVQDLREHVVKTAAGPADGRDGEMSLAEYTRGGAAGGMGWGRGGASDEDCSDLDGDDTGGCRGLWMLTAISHALSVL